jgi:hypothetical protein
MGAIEFNEERHEYTLDGRLLPNVTRILAPLTDIHTMPRDRVEFARQRGQAVHLGTALDDCGTLDPASVDPQLTGYLAAWRLFRHESGFVPRNIEYRVAHALYGYAGTEDRDGRMRITPPGALDLIDIKATADIYQKVVGPQTAAYAKALQAQDPTTPLSIMRWAVQLRPDGTYRLHPCTDPNDFNVFLAALTLYQWREKHGGTNDEGDL